MSETVSFEAILNQIDSHYPEHVTDVVQSRARNDAYDALHHIADEIAGVGHTVETLPINCQNHHTGVRKALNGLGLPAKELIDRAIESTEELKVVTEEGDEIHVA